MVLSYIDVIVHHKVLRHLKSIGTLISPLKLCFYYVKYINITTSKIRQYLHNFTGEIIVPTDFDRSNTLWYAITSIYDSIIDSSIYKSSGRTDFMSKIG